MNPLHGHTQALGSDRRQNPHYSVNPYVSFGRVILGKLLVEESETPQENPVASSSTRPPDKVGRQNPLLRAMQYLLNDPLTSDRRHLAGFS